MAVRLLDLQVFTLEIRKRVYTQWYIVPLFVTAPNGNNPNTRQYVEKKLWCIHGIEYDSVIKRNKIPIHGIVWINIKNAQLLF